MGKKTSSMFNLLVQYVDVMKIANPSDAVNSLDSLAKKVLNSSFILFHFILTILFHLFYIILNTFG